MPLGRPAAAALAAWLAVRHDVVRPDGRPDRVRQRAWQAAHAARRAAHHRPPVADAHPSPCAAAHVRHPSARRRRRPAVGAGTARSLRRGNDPALHSRQPRATAGRLQQSSPTRMSIVPRRPRTWRCTGTRWLQAAQNAAAREHLIVHYSPLVKFVAGRVGAGLPSQRRPRRPRQLRGVRSDRRRRALRPRTRRQVRDVRRAADQRRDLRRAARARLGAALGAGPGTRGRAGDRRPRGTQLGRSPTDDELAAHLRHRPRRSCGSGWRRSPSTTIGPLERAVDRRRRAARRLSGEVPIVPVDGDGGPRGARRDAGRDRQAARTGEARAVAVLRRGPHAGPDQPGARRHARAGCRRSTPSRCCTCGPAWPPPASADAPASSPVACEPARHPTRRPSGGAIVPVHRPSSSLASLLSPSPRRRAPSCLLAPPVAAPVVDPFREPPCAWCPGNRGIEYGPPAGDAGARRRRPAW